MKKLFLLSVFVFIAGLVMKVFHVHYNAIVMLFAVFLMFVLGIAGGTGQKRGFPLLFSVPYALCALALVFMLKFYPFHFIMFYVALVAAVLSMVLMVLRKWYRPASLLFPLVAMLVLVHFTPAHKIYYMFNIRYNYEIRTDYLTWDKYSWFLYRAGEDAEALQASLQARQIAENMGDKEYVRIIDEHYRQIQAKTWDHYHHQHDPGTSHR